MLAAWPDRKSNQQLNAQILPVSKNMSSILSRSVADELRTSVDAHVGTGTPDPIMQTEVYLHPLGSIS